MGTTMTDFELDVAQRIDRGQDPWGAAHFGSSSRYVSQAIGRLKRKGLVRIDDDNDYALTDAGMEALAAAQKEVERG